MITDLHESFLQLVRLGVGTETVSSFKNPVPSAINWAQLKVLADEQGLLAIVLDGIDKLNESISIPLQMKLEWIGEVIQSYEQRYTDYEKALGELAGFYQKHNIKMMVLKGYGLSLNYPNPKHRPCGDIDTWNYGKQKEADRILTRELGIPVDTSEHHHTIFLWKGYMVENHYDFLNIFSSKSNSELELLLKELAKDDSYKVAIGAVDVYFPSPNMNALFLLRHALNHFARAGVNLRNLLDWAFFWGKNGDKVNWVWLSEILQKYSMMDFFHIINRICIEDLGFEKTLFPETNSRKSYLKERVLREIISPEADNKKAHNPRFIPRLIFKMHRWSSNSWKRQLCYNEGQVAAFVTSVWSHLLKPNSI